MADIDDYLEEGFDPRSVTVPRLRSILVTHNIEYPGTAKKSQLVELVEQHVLPQAPKLRAQRARAKRSSMGIVNAGSPEDNGTWDDYDLPPPSTVKKRSKSPRKTSSRIKVEDDVLMTPAPRSPTKRSTRSVSRALSHTDEPDYHEAPRSVRQPRRSVTPQIKQEPEEDEDEEEEEEEATILPDHEESVFTYDNPFQSGSSPAQNKTPTNRRRTVGGDSVRSVKSSSRLRTSGYSDDYEESYQPQTPIYREPTPDLLEPGEEFTPNEQLELEEAASRGETAVEPRKPAGQVTRKGGFKAPLLVLFLSLFGAYLAWYRQEKIAVGYCEVGGQAKSLVSPDFPVPDALLPFVEPQCEPCPAHAYCYGDYSVRCESGFILKPHPLSLGGLVPVPPTCEPDGEKARRVKAVADKAIEELRERRAQYECGELVTEDGHKEDSPAIPEHELKKTVSRKRSHRLSEEEFDELWAAAIGEVATREEVEIIETAPSSDSSDLPDRQLSSTSLASLPLACAVKRSLRLSLARYRLTIGLLISAILGVFYMRARYRKHVATKAQIPALVDTVLGRLANQKELGEGIDDPWLFLPNLRDDVLRTVHSLSERERIWQRVRAVVEQNSNVRTSQREGRSGEVGRAWEWIGPVAGEGARRRRSGRVSVGPDLHTDSPEASKATPQMKKWEEPRPLY
ncbi:inner nuclear membrane protein enriched at telomere/subtelomere region [Fusarium irregulare]|uniref:Inner nuclear membrane protein enriched at telomere/subtelomere region n=1 Tax=Fusarium irregulare TaxID=2494466 RepID=A0A9W8UAF8_9HYPO|nr:inner nuclear membrane protein enriched at telomere/subtelomere region [Fusarium irregulare]KAJ4023520.1 inner nuclear membrane protein enriched at telomere/subtelomere region [Fusarium irregulare]